MRTTIQDVRFGFRVFTSRPGFAAVAILTLALGIASTTTVFTWIDTTLLRPFHGAADPDSLSVLEAVKPSAPNGGTALSWLDFRDFRDNLELLSGLAIRRQCAFTIGDGVNAQLAWGEVVSGNYFDFLGIRPGLGRMFSPDEQDDTIGAHPVVVISDRLWRVRFHSDPSIAGKTLRVNRIPLTIVGVAASDFHGSNSVMLTDLWTPVTMGVQLATVGAEEFRDRGDRIFDSIARRAPGVSNERARAEVSTVAARFAAAYPKTNRGVSATVLAPWQQHNGVDEYLAAPLRILMVVSLVVLLIVCANVANLLLARSVARQREFGIRIALGAGRVRVARQLLTETLMLTIAGAVIAFPMLLWMLGAISALVPSVGLPIAPTLPLNGRVFAFTIAICVITALISATAPALFSMRADVNETLKEGGRSGAAAARSRRTRSLLVIVEVALAAVAMIGAGLFVRSFQNARSIYPGFNSNGVLFGRFFIESAAYSREQILQFSSTLRQRLESTPGIETVTYSDFVPLSSTAGPYNYTLPEGYVPSPEEVLNINRSMVSPGYFGMMRIPLLAGRDFTALDDRQSAPVMIVTEAYARRFFRGENPVGRKVRVMGKMINIVGLVKDSKYFFPTEPARPFFYLSFHQFYGPTPELYFFIRTKGDPVRAIPALRRAVASVDPAAGGFHAVSLAEYTQVTLFGQKLAASLTGALGAMCLVLAALGLYSVMSYSVGQRASEIGIRMAMGARPANVIGMVIGEGMVLAGTGLAIGMSVAFAVTRLVSAMLFRVEAFDPLTVGGVALFLSAVALLATWLPARSATRTDPMKALRA